jgi:hypothetical protein
MRTAGTKAGNYLVQLHSWLRNRGIPEQFFFRSDDTVIRGGGALGVIGRDGDKDHRRVGLVASPQYMDTSNWLLLRMFARALAGSDRGLMIQEALPGPSDWTRAGSTRVREYAVEMQLKWHL